MGLSVALGERVTKDIFEALRAGKGWQKTLFLTVYDVKRPGIPHDLRDLVRPN